MRKLFGLFTGNGVPKVTYFRIVYSQAAQLLADAFHVP